MAGWAGLPWPPMVLARRLAERVRGLAAFPPPQGWSRRHWRGFLSAFCMRLAEPNRSGQRGLHLLGRVRPMAGKSKNDWLSKTDS